MSDTLLTIIPKDFYKDRCVIGYGYEVGKLRFKHIRPRLVLAPPPPQGGELDCKTFTTQTFTTPDVHHP